jgi:hypothetical protein
MRAALWFSLGVTIVFAAPPAHANELTFVSISAQEINCIFDTSCQPSTTDSVSLIPLAGVTGRAAAHTRTIPGGDMSRGAGKVAYLYRVNLTAALGNRCISALKIPFGAIEKMPYTERGPYADLFVVVSGSLGSIGLSAAERNGNLISVTFSKPVCAGVRPGEGESSLFFGLSAAEAPKLVWAEVDVASASSTGVQVRAAPAAEEPKPQSQSSERRGRKKRRP